MDVDTDTQSTTCHIQKCSVLLFNHFHPSKLAYLIPQAFSHLPVKSVAVTKKFQNVVLKGRRGVKYVIPTYAKASGTQSLSTYENEFTVVLCYKQITIESHVRSIQINSLCLVLPTNEE